MKKMFTLLLSVGSMGAAFAQPPMHGSYGNRELVAQPVYQSAGYNYSDRYPSREREAQIADITRSFHAKMDAVHYDRFMRPFEKSREIDRLQYQMDREIRMVDGKFQGMQRHDDRDFNWRH